VLWTEFQSRGVFSISCGTRTLVIFESPRLRTFPYLYFPLLLTRRNFRPLKKFFDSGLDLIKRSICSSNEQDIRRIFVVSCSGGVCVFRLWLLGSCSSALVCFFLFFFLFPVYIWFWFFCGVVFVLWLFVCLFLFWWGGVFSWYSVWVFGVGVFFFVVVCFFILGFGGFSPFGSGWVLCFFFVLVAWGLCWLCVPSTPLSRDPQAFSTATLLELSQPWYASYYLWISPLNRKKEHPCSPPPLRAARRSPSFTSYVQRRRSLIAGLLDGFLLAKVLSSPLEFSDGILEPFVVAKDFPAFSATLFFNHLDRPLSLSYTCVTPRGLNKCSLVHGPDDPHFPCQLHPPNLHHLCADPR